MQVSTSTNATNKDAGVGQSVFPVGQMTLFVLVTVLFFLWGMSNNLTDILVQQFRKSFELSQFGAQLVQTANFLGYFCMAIPAALVMRRWGYKAGMVLGLVLFGGGMVLFWPAAVSGQYVPFLIALFAVGCGASVLETAANPFMAQFGPAATSERRLNFAQSFNPPGTVLGVIIGAQFIFSGVELREPEVAAMRQAGTYAAYLHTELMRVVPTYLALGSVVLLFALVLSRMKFPSLRGEHEDHSVAEDQGSFKQLLRFQHLWFAVLANFCNVGAQVSTWSSLIPYMKQYTNVSERTAAGYLTATLIAMLVGRFVTTPLMKYIPASKILGAYGAANVLLIALAITRPGMLGAYAIVASSFFLSIMFPTIFALGLKGLGASTKLAGSFLVMAIVGGAVFPPILGWIAKRSGSLADGYIVPAVGFAGVSLYGFLAGRVRPREVAVVAKVL
ncbi:L-fucose:H+ symporter permease [Granulicella sp. dw_53]|uniref:L-fucose:H+ symporter permease n=1 Tax=Granulicella sp. dw_53 TaxID=2719792 RepID=UPI002102445E|nr:L-fucose:H+ symporter permease [Granulicella sp. dw_53]